MRCREEAGGARKSTLPKVILCLVVVTFGDRRHNFFGELASPRPENGD
jgi:hypothetical protein